MINGSPHKTPYETCSEKRPSRQQERNLYALVRLVLRIIHQARRNNDPSSVGLHISVRVVRRVKGTNERNCQNDQPDNDEQNRCWSVPRDDLALDHRTRLTHAVVSNRSERRRCQSHSSFVGPPPRLPALAHTPGTPHAPHGSGRSRT